MLNNTDSKAVLIECCFVDSEIDYDAWSGSKCAKAIVEGILDKSLDDSSES